MGDAIDGARQSLADGLGACPQFGGDLLVPRAIQEHLDSLPHGVRRGLSRRLRIVLCQCPGSRCGNLLLHLARDLPAVWNAPSTDMRTKQRLVHILVREIVFELDNATNEAVLLIHWIGGRHTTIRIARVKTGRYPEDRVPAAVDSLRKLAAHWPDR